MLIKMDFHVKFYLTHFIAKIEKFISYLPGFKMLRMCNCASSDVNKPITDTSMHLEWLACMACY